MSYDVIVLGGGPGGYVAAERAGQAGLKTLLIEQRALGGTCLNEGCIPSKVLLNSAKIYHYTTEYGRKFGVVCQGSHVDQPAVVARKEKVIHTLVSGVGAAMKASHVEVVNASGMIRGRDDEGIQVEADGKVYTGKNLIIATGSRAFVPPIPGVKEGLASGFVMTNREALALKELPRRLAVIGGGVIGVEFATLYSHLGCQVTLVEGMANLLPQLDRELGQNLAQILKKQGVEVLTSAMVQSVEQAAGGLCVHLEQKGKELTVTGEKVLCAIGRRAYFDGLFAAGLTPALNGKRLLVDESYQTSIPGVYAIGDASAAVQLAHVAAAQGTDCVERMCGGKGSIDLNVIPSCIYSAPEIAAVGLAEAEAREQGIPAVSGKCTLFSNARTIIEDPGRCFMKLVARTDTHELIGAQLMCQHASDMISQLSTAMVNRLTVEQLLTVMRPHPSFEEALGEAVENLASKLA